MEGTKGGKEERLRVGVSVRVCVPPCLCVHLSVLVCMGEKRRDIEIERLRERQRHTYL